MITIMTKNVSPSVYRATEKQWKFLFAGGLCSYNEHFSLIAPSVGVWIINKNTKKAFFSQMECSVLLQVHLC